MIRFKETLDQTRMEAAPRLARHAGIPVIGRIG
jgi:hypothetical protein